MERSMPVWCPLCSVGLTWEGTETPCPKVRKVGHILKPTEERAPCSLLRLNPCRSFREELGGWGSAF